MIDKDTLTDLVEKVLDGEHEFLVSVNISPQSDLRVLIDSDEGVSIERCIAVSRSIEASLDRDVEDYSLEVSSAGLGSPFLHTRQYLKHRGNPVRVLLRSGECLNGILKDADNESFSVETIKIIPAYTDDEGKKHKKSIITELRDFTYDEVKSTSYRFEK